MGQCYSITLRFKVKEKQESALASSLQEYTTKMGNMPKHTLEEYVKTIFSGWEDDPCEIENFIDGWVQLKADFDASYLWELTMRDGFAVMAPFLEDGSSLYVEPDCDHYTLKVKNGKIS